MACDTHVWHETRTYGMRYAILTYSPTERAALPERVPPPILLRAPYALSGTDIPYRQRVLGACYAVSGTDIPYGATRRDFSVADLMDTGVPCELVVLTQTSLSSSLGKCRTDCQDSLIRWYWPSRYCGTDARILWYQAVPWVSALEKIDRCWDDLLIPKVRLAQTLDLDPRPRPST
eukprot:3439164-Rhodomonas_salina.1